MKDVSVKLNRNIKMLRSCMLCVMALILVPLILEQTALAQKEPDVIAQPLKINGKEVKQYLIEKYELKKHDVTTTLKQTPNGPEGKLHLRGDIVPKNVAIAKGIKNREDRARAMTKALLEEETDLFGINNIDEMRETGIYTGKGYAGEYIHIRYHRYIDTLEVENSYIKIEIRPEIDKITWVDAELIPAPPELYVAVKTKTLSENEILDIVKQDLTSAGIDSSAMRLLSINKVAIPSSPYVIWKVDMNLKVGVGRWKYRIDAFTGEILKKRDALIR